MGDFSSGLFGEEKQQSQQAQASQQEDRLQQSLEAQTMKCHVAEETLMEKEKLLRREKESYKELAEQLLQKQDQARQEQQLKLWGTGYLLGGGGGECRACHLDVRVDLVVVLVVCTYVYKPCVTNE